MREADLGPAYILGAKKYKSGPMSVQPVGDVDPERERLKSTSMKNANLRKANLNKANLCRADLSDADLSEADLSRAELSGANLRRADLSGANLTGPSYLPQHLIQKQINEAYGDEATQLPDHPHLQRPAHWIKGDEESEEG